MTRLMPLSKGCQYALKTVAYLAGHPAGLVFTTGQLSRQTEIPASFLSKILQVLTHSGILDSHRGNVRGYSLSRPHGQISARDIIQACDGPLGHEACLLDEYRVCPGERICPAHRQRMTLQKRLNQCLGGILASDLSKVLPRRAGNGRKNGPS
jgi:Rrf2 family protein